MMASISAFENAVIHTLVLNVCYSIVSGWAAYHMVRQYIPTFMARGFKGADQCKVDRTPVAEPLGFVAAVVYLIFVIPFPFLQWLSETLIYITADSLHLRYLRVLSLMAAILCICTAILLGFADDMLDLRWRDKLLFPTLSSTPLLMVYYVSDDITAMRLPTFLQHWTGMSYIDFGSFFYVYMIMLVIFCTNAINIIAGINGIEVGQSVVIAISVAIFNVVQICRLDHSSTWYHTLSFCLLGPFIATSIGLFIWNRYPARAFVGDTYCYWAGMNLAVVAIIGHFSKTLLLFLIPQIFNFLYSCPQLFKFVPCPRHRLPRLDAKSGKLTMSMTTYEHDKIGTLGRLFVKILRTLRLLHYREYEKDGQKFIECNNMTILNLALKFFGPTYEYELTNRLLLFQTLCSVFAFVCRFYLSGFIYDNVH